MGSITTKKKSATTVIVPADAAQVDGAQITAPQETAPDKEKRSANRAARILRGADGKAVHGLTDITSVSSAGYVYGTHLLVRQQFAAPTHWFAFCAWRAEQEAQDYHAKAADALANPAAYKAQRVARGNAVQEAQVNKLAALVAQLLGKTTEEVLASL